MYKILALSVAVIFVVAANAQREVSAQFSVGCVVLGTETRNGVVSATSGTATMATNTKTTATNTTASASTPHKRFVAGGLPSIPFRVERVIGGGENESFSVVLPATLQLESKSGPQPSYVRVAFNTDDGTPPIIEEIE